MSQVTYPGVYIQEFVPAAPIVGVGTSTAAFVGPTLLGDVLVPTKVMSWDSFRAGFGEDPLDGTLLWYAVRGYFQNGGQVCYIVRASNAQADRRTFKDRAADVPGAPAGTTDADTLVVRARRTGPQSPPVRVAVTNANALAGVSNTRFFRPTATLTSAQADHLVVSNPADARTFTPGDHVTWTGAPAGDHVVTRVEANRIYVANPLTPGALATQLKLADMQAGVSDDFRLEAGGDRLAPGSVVVLTQTGPALREVGIVKTIAAERFGTTVTHRVTLRTPVSQNIGLGKATAVASPEFGLQVTQATAPAYAQTYDRLSLVPDHPRYFGTVLAADATRRIDATETAPPSTTAIPFNQPRAIAAQSLSGGVPDDLSALGVAEYTAGLDALAAIDDVNLVSIPDRQDAATQAALLQHCERLQDRFAIFDSRIGNGLTGANSVEAHRNEVDSANGYGALYYPWLLVPSANGRTRMLVPPSGHVAGVYARTDLARGVHKAPAGRDGLLNGVVGVERSMSDVEQGQLNILGVNVVRVFRPGGRAVVWGARTTSPPADASWRYVNVRRLFLFLEESIAETLQATAVFEPNNLALWQGLKRTIGDFLRKAWRDGALFGATPEDAYYVRIDEVLNPFSEQALGRLNIEIGARPAYPAEFIVIRIGIWDGGSEITET